MPVNGCFIVNLKINFIIVRPCFNKNFLKKLFNFIWVMAFLFCIFWEVVIITLMNLKRQRFLLIWSFTSLKHYLFIFWVETDNRMVFPVIVELIMLGLFKFNISIAKILFVTLFGFKLYFFLVLLGSTQIPTSFFNWIFDLYVALGFIIIKQRFILSIFVLDI